MGSQRVRHDWVTEHSTHIYYVCGGVCVLLNYGFVWIQAQEQIVGPCGNSMLSFLRTLHTIFHSGCTSLHPRRLCRGAPFSPRPLSFVIYACFNDGRSDWCEVTPLCSFALHFSNNQWCWASFHMPTGHLCVFFGEMFIKACPVFHWVVFCGWWVVWATCIL